MRLARRPAIDAAPLERSGRSLKFRMPYHGRMVELVFDVVQEADGGYCAGCLTKTSSRKRIRGRGCGKTLLNRQPHSSSISQDLRAFVSTSSATKFYPSHEDPAQRSGRAFCGGTT